MLNQSLSKLIKRAREDNNLTQATFGRFFEPTVAQSTVARWEKGDLLPNRKRFPKIASLLNITLEEFCELISEHSNQANLEHAILKYCYVYGISDWNTNLNEAVQEQLSVCPYKTQPIYVDLIENARYKWLEVNSHKCSDISKHLIEFQAAITKNKASSEEKY